MPTFLGPFSDTDIEEEIFLKKLSLVNITIDSFSPPGTLNLGDIVLTGTRIVQVLINIKSGFNGSPILSIGTSSDPNRFADSSSSDLTETGVYLTTPLDTIEVASLIKAFWNPGGASQGSLEIFVILSDP